MELEGKVISKGVAEGEALTTSQPISFYGGVDPDTSLVIEKGHELEGKEVRTKILVFPNGNRRVLYTLQNEKEWHSSCRNHKQRM
jgi:hypothetical protein